MQQARRPMADVTFVTRAAPSNVRDAGENIIEFSAGDGSEPARIHSLSMMFDPDWYQSNYPESAAFRTPAEHYMQVGWQLGYDPNPFFSTRDYLRSNPELVGARMNPFIHYVLYGARLGRTARAGA